MKKEKMHPHKFGSISDAYRAFGLPEPRHPLISLINGAESDDIKPIIGKTTITNSNGLQH